MCGSRNKILHTSMYYLSIYVLFYPHNLLSDSEIKWHIFFSQVNFIPPMRLTLQDIFSNSPRFRPSNCSKKRAFDIQIAIFSKTDPKSRPIDIFCYTKYKLTHILKHNIMLSKNISQWKKNQLYWLGLFL